MPIIQGVGGVPLLLSALLIAGCVSDPALSPDQRAEQQAQQREEIAEDIEAILTEPLGQEAYVADAERCLSTYQYDSVEVLDDQHVVFKGRGKRLWLNTLRTRCIGLRRRDVLKFELRGNQLCNLDDFVAINPSAAWMHSSANCALGDFAPVTEEQVALIKATLEKK